MAAMTAIATRKPTRSIQTWCGVSNRVCASRAIKIDPPHERVQQLRPWIKRVTFLAL